MPQTAKSIKLCLIGGGSQHWSPKLIRDIIFKPGMENVAMEFVLLDPSRERAGAIQRLFEARLRDWNVDRVKIRSTADARSGLTGADFVLITIATGRLEAMRHDVAIPEKYGIYHTVGDTSGPGGWSRALRNIPVFKNYAGLIRRYAPNAFVLNYTNPMGALTKVLADDLGWERVIGLCHGLFENYGILKAIFGTTEEGDIRARFGGLNHFFWILDFTVKGKDGYALLRKKLRGRNLGELVGESHVDAMGYSSDKWLAGELYAAYGSMPYLGDRHTCEFFSCYITDLKAMERLKIKRTKIADRRKGYLKAARRIELWRRGKTADVGELTRTPSRETAADIVKAVTLNETFCDVVNMTNIGQIDNLPRGVVVETLGQVSGDGFTPLAIGSMPPLLVPLLLPHADVQARTVAAGLAGDLEGALQALVADPVCAKLTPAAVRKMGLELLRANAQWLPQFRLSR